MGSFRTIPRQSGSESDARSLCTHIGSNRIICHQIIRRKNGKVLYFAFESLTHIATITRTNSKGLIIFPRRGRSRHSTPKVSVIGHTVMITARSPCIDSQSNTNQLPFTGTYASSGNLIISNTLCRMLQTGTINRKLETVGLAAITKNRFHTRGFVRLDPCSNNHIMRRTCNRR